MNHLKSTLVRFATKHTCCSKWTPANAEESAQKSPAWSQMPWTLVDVPWENLEVDGSGCTPGNSAGDLFGDGDMWPFERLSDLSKCHFESPGLLFLRQLWLVLRLSSLPRSISAFSVNNSPHTQEVSTRNLGVLKDMGDWSKIAVPQKKQTHWMLTSSKMDSQNHYLGVYPWVCLWSVGPI